MQGGELRHRITVQQETETKTTRGGFTDGTPTVLHRRIPALVEPLTGRELDIAMQIDPRLRYSVTLRYHAGIQARQTVVYHAFNGDKTLEVVQPPQVDEKARTMVLMCSEATT